MLVLSRDKDETVKIIMDEQALEAMLEEVRRTGADAVVDVCVVDVRGKHTRLGFTAPKVVTIMRGELPDVTKTKGRFDR